jgi:hypothetical protein
MSEDTVAFSKEGVKLSYGRFLADSAGGYVLLIVCAHYLASTITVPSALTNTGSEAKSAAIVFAGVFILLLGPPFGLALNSLSWFLLGWIQVVFLNAWARYGLFKAVVNGLTYSTGQEYNVSLLHRTFTFLNPSHRRNAPKPRQSLYSQMHLIKKVMQIHHPHLLGRVEYLTGIKIFIRNLSLLSLGMAALWPGLEAFERANYLIAVAVLTVVACLLDLYGTLELVFSAYSVCLDGDEKLHALTAGTAAGNHAQITYSECLAALLAGSRGRGGPAAAAGANG